MTALRRLLLGLAIGAFSSACSGEDPSQLAGGGGSSDTPAHEPEPIGSDPSPGDTSLLPAHLEVLPGALFEPDETVGSPDGGADAGATSPPPKPPKMPLLEAGLHPDASDALRVLGITAAQIIQTIGTIPASAGTHEKDGVVNGLAYSAATDISVRNLTDVQIRSFLTRMTAYGFAGWYRKPGVDGWPASESPHFHIVYAGAPMKLSLRNQCRDFFVNRNGLVSHSTYTYLAWPAAARDAVKTIFLAHNPATQ